MTRSRSPRPVLLISHSYYEEDPRVRREAEALVGHGIPVDVVALRKPGSTAEETLDGVRVHRLPVTRHQGAGIRTYLAEYAEFFARAALAAVRLHARRRYAVAQVATLPDPLVFATAPLRLDGVPVVLDLHEAMPEFFRSRFPAASRPSVRSALLAAERASIAFASHVLTVNDALADRLLDLGVARDRLTVILNSPRSDRFDPDAHARRPFMADGCLRLVYAGALTPLYQLDVPVRAVALLATGGAVSGAADPEAETRAADHGTEPETRAADPAIETRAADHGTEARADNPASRAEGRGAVPGPIPPPLDVTLDLYGRGDAEPTLRALAEELGIADRVRFHGRIPVEDVAAAIAGADAGLAPTRRDEFTDFSLSTKIFEYAAMEKPVVASRLPTVERYFGDALCYFEPGDAASLAAGVRRLVDDDALRARVVEAAGRRVRELSWEREADRYVALIRGLAGGGKD